MGNIAGRTHFLTGVFLAVAFVVAEAPYFLARHAVLVSRTIQKLILRRKLLISDVFVSTNAMILFSGACFIPRGRKFSC